jgi:hypothetical protein
MFQLLLLLLVLVGIGLAVWAFVTTSPKKECKWKEYARKDNDGVLPCDDDKCRLDDTTEKECKKACCEMEKCKAVQWRSTDGRCLLKHSVGDINDAADEKTLFVKE